VNVTDITPSTLEQHKYTHSKNPRTTHFHYQNLESCEKRVIRVIFPWRREEGVIGRREEERGKRKEERGKREEGGGRRFGGGGVRGGGGRG